MIQNEMNAENRQEERKLRAVLVAVDDGKDSDFDVKIVEMKNLITACDMDPVQTMVQAMEAPNAATYIGKGKLAELRTLTEYAEADYCIFADNLSPAQLKNITDGVDTAVLDRTGLILEIFARRAKSREARLQVESANLHYLLPRLVGMRTSLGRQAGASGSLSNKGRGEKQLELDRRRIERKITEVNRELEAIEHDKNVQRSKRKKSFMPSVALVGYTNAGKSTLMNALLTGQNADETKKVFEKNMLFATLDTTVRSITFDDHKDFLLSDTVGFVSNLPHHLIKAFRSTLSESCQADLLLIVLDASDPYVRKQLEVTETTLRDLDCADIPRIYVMNKSDLIADLPKEEDRDRERVYISAKTGWGMEELVQKIKDILYRDNRIMEGVIPYERGDIVDQLNRGAHVLQTEYRADGTYIKADVPYYMTNLLDSYIK